MHTDIFTDIVDVSLDLDALHHKALRPDSGAIVNFLGTVRNLDQQRAVNAIDYEAHPSSLGILREIAYNAAQKFSDISSIVLVHRIGYVAVTEISIAIYVSAPHRAVAFQACEYLIDTVKQELPMWKKQYFSDGSYEWVNSA